MLVAEQKELAAYGAKIFDIWMISRKEGLARGSMYGSVGMAGFFSNSLALLILIFSSNLLDMWHFQQSCSMEVILSAKDC